MDNKYLVLDDLADDMITDTLVYFWTEVDGKVNTVMPMILAPTTNN